jgi:hypothetical protein
MATLHAHDINDILAQFIANLVKLLFAEFF